MSGRSDPPPDDVAFLQALGARLRMLRARRGMTRRLLAAQSGVSERYISAVEGGTGNGSILLLRAIARALNVALGALLEDEAVVGDAPIVRAPGWERRIALIGLRGAGKSTLGGGLAARLGVGFIELDRAIEAEAGMGLGEVLDLHGQAGLRRLERAVLDRLVVTEPAVVLAAGGGIVSERETFDTLLSHCFTVWLRATPEDHMQRVIDQGDLRPIRDNRQAMADLRAILTSRESLYARADVRVDTSGRSVAETLDVLTALVRHQAADGSVTAGAGPT